MVGVDLSKINIINKWEVGIKVYGNELVLFPHMYETHDELPVIRLSYNGNPEEYSADHQKVFGLLCGLNLGLIL